MSIKDYYDNGGVSGTYESVYTAHWVAQTFTASDSYNIKRVHLSLLKNGTPGTITVAIRACTTNDPATAKPTGANLLSVTFSGTLLTTSYQWYDIVFATSIALTSGTMYAIVVRNSTGTSVSNYIRWQKIILSPSYAVGVQTESDNSGSTWSNYSYDLLFVTHDEDASPPLAVTTPSPEDAGAKVSILSPTLSWAYGFLATSYDVYFGYAGEMAIVSSGQTALSYDVPGMLTANADYEWRIDAVNSEGTTEGTTWAFTTLPSSTLVRNIDFIYNSTIAYVAEFGNEYIRLWYNDAIITSIVSPYLTAHLFQLHVYQIGDTMWIVHESYAPRKLTRTSATTFSLDVIPYDEGPFLERNDLVHPDTISLAEMSFSSGNLVCTGYIFEAGHIGAIFKLIHPKPDAVVSLTGNGTSDSTEGYGSIQFITRGIWTGEIRIERNENGAGWDTFRTWKGSKSAEQNANYTFIENSYKTRFRIATTGASASFRGDLEIKERLQEGIVKVTAVVDSQNAVADPIANVASTATTKRWAEGAWSPIRTYPRSICFFEGRCVLMGERVIQKPVLLHIETPE